MARINIDDDVFVGKKWDKFSRTFDKSETAIGTLYYLFKEAQKYWIDGEKPIPKDVWDANEFPKSLIGTYVKMETLGYYVLGSEKQFAWLLQRQGAGKKSGQSRKNNKLGVERPLTTVQSRSTGRNGSEPLTLTPTLTLTQKNIYAPTLRAGADEVFKIYPKRQGQHRRKLGIERILKQLKSSKDPISLGESIKRAATNYAAHCRQTEKEGTEFVMQFATWSSNWEEWVDYKPKRSDTRTVVKL